MSARTPEPEGRSVPAAAGRGPRSRAVTVDIPDDEKTEEQLEAEAKKAENESALQELWRSFKNTGEKELRERLIIHYSPLVKYVAGRVGVGLPPNIEQADLVSY